MDKKSKVSSPPDEDETKVAVLGYPPQQSPLPHHHHYPGYPVPAPYHPGYPPSPSISPYAAGPPGYPNQPHQYPPMQNYYQPPHHPGYYNSAPLPPHVEFEPRPKILLARVILCLLVFLILGTVAMSLLTYIVFGSAVPFFDVAAFSVPSFNLSDKSLAGTWQANFSVENPNHGLDVMFERVESMVYYNEFLLANKMVEPFELKRNAKMVLPARISSPATRDGGNEREPPWKEMKSELDDSRDLEFQVALEVLATFKSGSDLSRRMTFTVSCYGLTAHFKDPGVGVWDGVKPSCTVLF
ncbi:PREDICTED: uncharacterized protein LOC109181114 [Ipomoea nil]|uniref:uncharacterized protein LOC109181114 n=1 Tax=Ipomoea nil TaxID=35883 RepID=UPI0009009F85|nr:PREDICTED: uncharacterized protein LOC109181114 [Ipomoea nil]